MNNMTKGIALITGASSGIGEALAREFARQDYDLIITARRSDRLEALARELRELVNVDIITCDLGEALGARHLTQAIDALGKDVDILVNNAGIAHGDDFHGSDFEKVEQLIALNVSALTHLTHHFIQPMVKRGAGKILNVASVAAFQPVPSMAAYAASKAFVLSLTESLSEELRGTGVSITALCPGLTKTELVEDLMAQDVPEFMMSSTKEVAREGYSALMANEVIRIPGVANQAAVTWAQHQPRWLVRGVGGLFARFKPGRT
jgi:short-subunit dehydrogenase